MQICTNMSWLRHYQGQVYSVQNSPGGGGGGGGEGGL